MKLSSLINQANATYNLGLGDDDVRRVHRRLRAAGYQDVVQDATAAIDETLRVVGNMTSAAHRVYSAMKVEAAVDHDGCPRCHQPFRVVALTGDRQANYCQGCAITLPLKV